MLRSVVRVVCALGKVGVSVLGEQTLDLRNARQALCHSAISPAQYPDFKKLSFVDVNSLSQCDLSGSP
jgi:hypothetical protein